MCTLSGCIAILSNQTDSRSIKSQLAPVFRWRWKRAGKFGTNAPLVVPNEIAHPLLQYNVLGGYTLVYTVKNRFYYGAKTLVKSSSSPSSSSPRQKTIMYDIIRGRVAKHLLGRLQQRRSTGESRTDPSKVYLAFGHAGRIVSDSFRTNNRGNSSRTGLQETHWNAHTAASHIILFLCPRDPICFSPSTIYLPTPPPIVLFSRRRCIMIVQMRAARGLPGSFKDPSPSSSSSSSS